jgi:hypothetical protein
MNVTRKHEAALQACIDTLTTLARKTDDPTIRAEIEREVKQLRTWNRTLPRLREWPIEVQARAI